MPELRHLLNWQDLPEAVWRRLVERAVDHSRARSYSNAAREKGLALMFFNPSLRTRASMEVAAAQLGAHVASITPGNGTWTFDWTPDGVMTGSEAEHIEEAVAVLSQYYDAIGVRLFASFKDRDADRDEARLHAFADASRVPVINLESAFWHPCQELADAATIARRFDGRPQGRKFVLTWAYHPRALPMAVPNSALMMAARSGMEVTVARPDGFELDDGVMDFARTTAEAAGGTVTETNDLDASVRGADVVYAKAWGGSCLYDDMEVETRHRNGLKNWRITMPRMESTNNGAFMHCLPVRRNVVVDTNVLKSTHAIHIEQAAFRLHAQKAILEHVWNLM